MSKIYFIVGTVGTGTTIIAGELVDSYRKNTQLAVAKLLGIPEKIKNAGTKPAAETLGKIESIIAAESSADAVIFSGWRVPDHINEIFNSYPLATYIFTNASSELPYCFAVLIDNDTHSTFPSNPWRYTLTSRSSIYDNCN